VSQVVNLNQARKAKTKVAAKRVADSNAVKFGRTKAQKKSEKSQAEMDTTRLDGAKRDP